MPIPIDKLRAIDLIVVHNDADGYASGMIIKDVLPQAEVRVVAYDSPEHKGMKAEPGMIFCDFSPYKDRYQEFVDAGAIVLDHHHTQRPIVEAFGELGVYGENSKLEAGAWLAYREVWLPLMEDLLRQLPNSTLSVLKRPGEFDRLKALTEDFALRASIRDTWQTGHPRWREACEQGEALQFWSEDKLFGTPREDWDQLLELGPILFERKLAKARKGIDGGYRWTSTRGTRCISFVGIYQASDAAEILHEEVDVLIAFTMYLQEGQPYLRCSCRSHTGWDVGAFAKTFPGGGGHEASSGFHAPLDVEAHPNAYAMIRGMVEDYEATLPSEG